MFLFLMGFFYVVVMIFSFFAFALIDRRSNGVASTFDLLFMFWLSSIWPITLPVYLAIANKPPFSWMANAVNSYLKKIEERF